ncbi:MAG: M3 family metallopeptidase [Rhodothermales bacterium]
MKAAPNLRRQPPLTAASLTCHWLYRMSNPLLQTWTTPFGLPPFDAIQDDHYKPAFKQALLLWQKEVQAISTSDASPTFENTVLALAQSGRLLDQVVSTFANLTNTDTNATLQTLETEFYPELTQVSDALFLDKALFARVQAVYDARETLNLDNQDARLLELTHRDFVRRGAALGEDAKARLKTINTRLAELTTTFSQHLLAETKQFQLVIENEAELEGLPDALRSAAKKAAEAKSQPDAWVFGLDRSMYEPFMTYAAHRGHRKTLFDGYRHRGANGGTTDNRALLHEIAVLRAERAELLGYATFADYQLEPTMAKTTQQAHDFLLNVWSPALERARTEREQMQALIDAEGGGFTLEGWDWWYYAEKLRQQHYALDEGALQPYFDLPNVRDGVFHTARHLFGLDFLPLDGVPVWNEGVEAYEVHDTDGSHLGVFLLDAYARDSKRGGAWMSTYRDADGTTRPLVTNNLNLMRPDDGQPTLMRFDEVETLFHEFGHALHGLMTGARHTRFSGTSGSPRDYVEFPSQFMEHYAAAPEVLNAYATHHATGEVIPHTLIEKLRKASTHNQGFRTTEFIAAALVDLAWHTRSADELRAIDDVQVFEAEVLKNYGLLPQIEPRYRSPYFSHIFSSPSGYAAGYYAYLWSEILDADGFDAFEQTGNIFDPTLAERLSTNVYRAGYAAPGDVLYRRFRGQDPDIAALLKNRGLS